MTAADDDAIAGARPGLLQQKLDELVEDLPRTILNRFLRDKLMESGVEPKPDLVEALSNHLLSGKPRSSGTMDPTATSRSTLRRKTTPSSRA